MEVLLLKKLHPTKLMDIISSETRSKMMATVRSRDTKPEKKVRSLLHALGYRFRLHRRDLPGNPDIVLPKLKRVIFVNGCFWHQHPNCVKSKRPDTRRNFGIKSWTRTLNATNVILNYFPKWGGLHT